MEIPGFEPGASYMRSKRSTTELYPLANYRRVKYLIQLPTPEFAPTTSIAMSGR